MRKIPQQNRRNFLAGAGAGLFSATGFRHPVNAAETSDKDLRSNPSSNSRSNRATLIDARWIHHSHFLSRQLARVERASVEPVLAPAGAASTIHPADGGGFIMWYSTVRWVKVNGVRTHQSWIHYATSKDGVVFEEPDLGIHEGNVIIKGDQIGADGKPITGPRGCSGFCVLDAHHQEVPHARARYTALYRAWVPGRHGGFSLAHSDDGLHWTEYPENPIRVGESDTFNVFFYDQRIKKYVAYIRPHIHAGPKSVNRSVARIVSDDMIHWGDERVVLDTDDRDAPAVGTINEAKLSDGTRYPRGRNQQYYGLTACPHGENFYLGLASLYDVEPGVLALELVHSYDGIDWRREVSRKPLISPGDADAWDGGSVYYAGAGSPLEVGDDWLIYYHGLNFDHHMRNVSREDLGKYRAMGAVRMKRDRLIGYRADDNEGELLSRAFDWNGEALFLNVEAKHGRARVVICHENGHSIKGFHPDDALAIEQADGVRIPVSFRSNASLASLKGRKIRLRIHLENACLYGWESS